MRILGLKVIGHDEAGNEHVTGAALLDGDRTFAISQERLDRIKYSPAVPHASIAYCLEAAGLKSLDDIDLVAVEEVVLDTDWLKHVLDEQGLWSHIRSKTVFVNHHDTHAASAFFCSPFEDAAVLVVDGGGQRTKTPKGSIGVETESFYLGKNNAMELLHRNQHREEKSGLLETLGVGNFYAQTTHFINFGKNEEGKTMGLAPYGKGRFMDIPPKQFVKKISPWEYVFPTVLEPHPLRDWRCLFKKHAYSRREAWLNLLKGYIPHKDPYFKKLPELFSSISRRPKEVAIPDNLYTEIAFWTQEWLERVMIAYAQHLHDVTKSTNLCIAGGVGLNSVANKKILDMTPFKHIFIQPASSDFGNPLGAALWAKHQLQREPIRWRMNHAYLGKTYGEEDICKALAGKAYRKLENPAKAAAELIAQGKIIGWFQGASEYGPRALGNRSILCSPIPPGMKDKINAQVKHRESFRPFAPAILEENVSEYFDLDCPSPFMLLIAQVKKGNIPAVTHIDGTARVQTISRQQNRLFYDLIREFKNITGVPVVLNTSFNDNGEPIVETPADAIRTFEKTHLDALIIGSYLLLV